MSGLVIMHDQQAVTTSLKVAEIFNKRHTHVIEAIENKIHSAENPAQYDSMFVEGEYTDPSGKTNKLYYLNRDGFSFIAFGFTGKKADSFKLSYIQAFNQMEREVRLGVPQTLPEALRLAADQAEQIEQQRKTIELQAPKALFADAVSASSTSILVGSLAKILRQNGVQIGQNRLFAWLRDHGYLISAKTSDWNTPTQRSMDAGWFEIKESTHLNGDGVNVTTKTTKVTGDGQQYFINKFLGSKEV